MFVKFTAKRSSARPARKRLGVVLVELGLVLAGVALVALAAVAIYGHKTSDMIAALASVLPGAHADDNAPIISGKLVETTAGTAAAPIELDTATIITNSATERLGNNMGVSLSGLVIEP